MAGKIRFTIPPESIVWMTGYSQRKRSAVHPHDEALANAIVWRFSAFTAPHSGSRARSLRSTRHSTGTTAERPVEGPLMGPVGQQLAANAYPTDPLK
jgi:hypothetical protein